MNNTTNALFQIAYSGLLARQREMELISHNIANLQTTGFKRFQAEMAEAISTGADEADWQVEGTRLAATRHIMLQGVIRPTGQTWDLALDGPGFFQVRRPDGGIMYTRDGAFHVDATGRLVTGDGYILLPETTIPERAQDVYVDRDGSVYARVDGQVQRVATIEIATFPNPEGLQAVGGNRYVVTPASGAAQVGQPGSDGYGQIVSQALESSNVDLATEMMGMIVAQRAYGLALRALQMADRMEELAVELRG
ncbi:MAG: flagellar basal-body rod protein FlgG [Anaerolineae bacterium]